MGVVALDRCSLHCCAALFVHATKLVSELFILPSIPSQVGYDTPETYSRVIMVGLDITIVYGLRAAHCKTEGGRVDNKNKSGETEGAEHIAM